MRRVARMRFAEDGEPPSATSAVMTRLFDLLLVGGYLACFVLTYLLIADKPAEQAPPPPPPVVEEAVVVEDTPVETPPAAPTPTPEPPNKDLLEAMTKYVNLINQERYTSALTMRADDNIPSMERMKKTKKMTLLEIESYPRLRRDRGSVYVKLAIEKDSGELSWQGRIDWEKRGNRWVTVKWNSSASTPTATVAPPTPTPALPELTTPTPEPTPSGYDFSFSE